FRVTSLPVAGSRCSTSQVVSVNVLVRMPTPLEAGFELVINQTPGSGLVTSRFCVAVRPSNDALSVVVPGVQAVTCPVPLIAATSGALDVQAAVTSLVVLSE